MHFDRKILPTPSLPSAAEQSPRRQLLRGLTFTLLVNTVIAVLLTYSIRQTGGLWENMVFSHCIGLIIYAVIDAGRLWLWGADKPPLGGLVSLQIVGIVTGVFAGHWLARRLLGLPRDLVLDGDHLPLTLGVATIAGFVACYMFWSTARLSSSRQQVLQLELDRQRTDRALLTARLQLLQAQIEPHFLFNTLANLDALIGIDPAQARRMLARLSDYLRRALAASRAETTTLGEEFELLRAWLDIQQMRFGKRLSHVTELAETLSSFAIAPMLIQPLVENALRHGIEPGIAGGRVELRAYRREAFVIVEVCDDGVGLSDQPSTAGTGLGLRNVRERLHGLYGERAALQLQARAEGGVCATLRIPA